MKFLIVLACLSAAAFASKGSKESGMGSMEGMELSEDQVMFLERIAPILMKMKKHKMAKEAMKPDLGEMSKNAFCYGKDSAVNQKAMDAMAACGFDKMGGMEGGMGGGMEGSMEGSMEGGMEQGMNRAIGQGKGSMEMEEEDMMEWTEEEKMHHLAMVGHHLHAMKCFFKEMGWANQMGEGEDAEFEISRETVAEDIESTLFSESVRGVEEQCFEMSQSMTPDCLDGDMMEEEEPAMMRANEDKKEKKQQKKEEKKQKKLEKKEKKKQKKEEKKEKKKNKGKGSAEEEMDPLEEAVMKTVQDMAYFGCVKGKLEKACNDKIQHFLEYVQMKKGKFAKAWNELPTLVERYPEAPPAEAKVFFPSSGMQISTGQKVITENVVDPPNVYCDLDPEAYYTVVDFDESLSDGRKYIHWMKTNAKGSDINNSGVDNFPWIPSITFERITNDEGSPDIRIGNFDFSNNHVVYVYRQPDMLDIEEQQSTCDISILGGRVVAADQETVPQKYNMDLVCGQVYRVITTQASLDMLCEYTKCIDRPFPYAKPGVTDREDCGSNYLKNIEPKAPAP